MNFCVLIKISKQSVSFWYQTEGNTYFPLTIKDSNEVSLYFYVNGNDFIFGNTARDRFYKNDPNTFGNFFEIIKDPSKHFSIYGNKKPVKQLFYHGIEQYLSYFLNTVLYKGDSIESYRLNFPLRFLFEVDIEEKEKSLIEHLFSEAGYDNIGRIDLNECLFEILIANGIIEQNAVVLLLDGCDNTLYVELYKDVFKESCGSINLVGHGADPRVKILAEIIIEDIISRNSYLAINPDIEIGSLLSYSASILENISPIITGDAVLSDGKTYYFRVKERSLTERLHYYSNEAIIYSNIDDLLKINNLDIENVIVLLYGEEINTPYFSNKLSKKYPTVKGIDKAFTHEAMKLVFSKIAQSGYLVDKKISIASPPVASINNVSSDPSKPNIPPIIPPKRVEINSKSEGVLAKPPLPPANKPALPPVDNSKNKPPIPPAKGQNMTQPNSGGIDIIGKEGITITELKPDGLIEINGKKYNAYAEGVGLSIGRKVKVQSKNNERFRVIEIETPPSKPPLPPVKKKLNFQLSSS